MDYEKLHEIEDLFEKHDDEYLEFEKIENPPFLRPDLCAFVYLDKLFSNNSDMICSAEHDQIWLDIEDEDLIKLTEDDVIYLRRCGVMFDNGLSMFL